MKPDTAKLEKAVKEAEALDSSQYTEDSWSKVQTALDDAVKALVPVPALAVVISLLVMAGIRVVQIRKRFRK